VWRYSSRGRKNLPVHRVSHGSPARRWARRAAGSYRQCGAATVGAAQRCSRVDLIALALEAYRRRFESDPDAEFVERRAHGTPVSTSDSLTRQAVDGNRPVRLLTAHHAVARVVADRKARIARRSSCLVELVFSRYTDCHRERLARFVDARRSVLDGGASPFIANATQAIASHDLIRIRRAPPIRIRPRSWLECSNLRVRPR